MSISDKDRQIVRKLAQRVAEVAADPIQDKKLAEWKRHNSLKPGKPMVLQAPEGVWEEFVPGDFLQCEDPLARQVEHHMRTVIYKIDHLRDDEPIVARYRTHYHIQITGYGVEGKTTWNPEATGVHGACHFDPVIEADADVETLFQDRFVTVDHEASQRQYQQVCDLIGDLFEVELVGQTGGWSAPMDCFIQWRGLDNMMFDLIDRPEWIHRAMDRLTVIDMDVMRQLQEQGMLSLNNGANYVGSGGIGATDELPGPDFDGEHVRLKDMWGFATTQIFSEVSPEMHDEFVIPYESRFLDQFGMSCYGCCEPLHKKIHLVRKLPRVRRVSMSPWIEPVEGAEAIGGDIIFSFKPNPSYLSMAHWDLDVCRQEMIGVLEACKANGCVSEYIMKDTHTCCNEPERYDQWTDMAMELAEQYA